MDPVEFGAVQDARSARTEMARAHGRSASTISRGPWTRNLRRHSQGHSTDPTGIRPPQPPACRPYHLPARPGPPAHVSPPNGRAADRSGGVHPSAWKDSTTSLATGLLNSRGQLPYPRVKRNPLDHSDTPQQATRNRLSPFSTEKVVYAVLTFRGCTRFQQLWISLLIKTA